MRLRAQHHTLHFILAFIVILICNPLGRDHCILIWLRHCWFLMSLYCRLSRRLISLFNTANQFESTHYLIHSGAVGLNKYLRSH